MGVSAAAIVPVDNQSLAAGLASAGFEHIAIIGTPGSVAKTPGAFRRIEGDCFWSSDLVSSIVSWFLTTHSSHLLWFFPGGTSAPAEACRRLLQVALDTGAGIVYADFFDADGDSFPMAHPLIDFQPGSMRDDFDFGPLVCVSRLALEKALYAAPVSSNQLKYGGWYDLRLRLSEVSDVFHLGEPLCVRKKIDHRSSGEKNFDYVDPKNRDYQLEMEDIATSHLKRIGAFLIPPAQGRVATSQDHFSVKASVVIPVRNRCKTVADAIKSALAQQTQFPLNVIVVDNHSHDGTTEIVATMAKADPRVVHLIPNRRDLGIGGCWNEAIFSSACGEFAVQLDSDDLYDGSQVLARIIAGLEAEGCAMLIGSYTIVDFNLQSIPPGLINHQEWTAQNGLNNALRIHGLGAPRAFHVPTLRTIGFPNVSYGEDYAVALRISRSYRIGRIFDSLYWCRRWEENSDSALTLDATQRYAFFKDKLRSVEIIARRRLNAGIT